MSELVKWPKLAARPTSRDLPIGTFFTVKHEPQFVWMTTREGYVLVFVPPGSFGNPGNAFPHSKTPVFILDLTTPPQFTVRQ